MFFAEFPDQFTDLNDLFWIKSYGWFIKDDDFRIAEDRLGKSYPLFVSFHQMEEASSAVMAELTGGLGGLGGLSF